MVSLENITWESGHNDWKNFEVSRTFRIKHYFAFIRWYRAGQRNDYKHFLHHGYDQADCQDYYSKGECKYRCLYPGKNTDAKTNNNSDSNLTLTREEQTELEKQTKDEELNQQATNTNTRLQPWYTGSGIALNLSQILYFMTASVFYVVGQGTSIVQTGTNIVGTLLSVLKP